MNIQKTLFAVAVLALMVGCTWAATEASGAAGFAVIPDNEAAQILGGVGWACNTKQWDNEFYPCGETEEDCSVWVLFYETWQCGDAPSGECYENTIVTGLSWGACAWNAEFGYCWYDGPGYDVPVYACVQ